MFPWPAAYRSCIESAERRGRPARREAAFATLGIAYWALSGPEGPRPRAVPPGRAYGPCRAGKGRLRRDPYPAPVGDGGRPRILETVGKGRSHPPF